MQNKLQQLTEKIYSEGVAKGNEEADKIISNARHDAESIIKEANIKADSIIKAAEKKAKELNENTRSELKLASKQILNTIKQNITEIINGSILTNPVKESLGDKSFVKNIIEKIVSNWNPNNPSSADLDIILPAKDKTDLDNFFKKEAGDLLNKGVSIQFHNGLKSGFQIGPKDGSFKVSFSDNEFENYFKEYLRPKLVELLFEK